jgi:CopG family nickel-responsive transcriptional regulator
MSNKVERITISVEAHLLAKFENYLSVNGYPTRSEAIKSLMRQALIEQEWQQDTDVAGTISLVYDHHKRGTMEKLVDVQHDFGSLIVCSQHVHLDHHNCMEVLVVRGRAAEVRDILAKLKAVKGIKHSALMMATTGEDVE